MPFIPCLTGAVALYRLDDETLIAVVVEAWDDTGAPYIAGDRVLVPATSRLGFVRLESASGLVADPARPVRQPTRGERPPHGGRPKEGVRL